MTDRLDEHRDPTAYARVLRGEAPQQPAAVQEAGHNWNKAGLARKFRNGAIIGGLAFSAGASLWGVATQTGGSVQAAGKAETCATLPGTPYQVDGTVAGELVSPDAATQAQGWKDLKVEMHVPNGDDIGTINFTVSNTSEQIANDVTGLERVIGAESALGDVQGSASADAHLTVTNAAYCWQPDLQS